MMKITQIKAIAKYWQNIFVAAVFSLAISFNLQAQETVIAVWDFAENSVAGDIHPDFASAANPDLTYLQAGGSGNNKGAILGAFLIWFVWSASELFLNGFIDIIANIFNGMDVSMLKNRSGYLRMLLIGLVLQFVLQKYPKGILPERRPAAPGE